MSQKSASMHDGILVIAIAVMVLICGFIASMLFH